VALGIELVPSRADALDALASEHGLHLLEHRAQAVEARAVGLHLHRAFDAVDGLEPVANHQLLGLGDATLGLAGRALAVVVQVRQRALVAILEPLELDRQFVACGKRLIRRSLGCRPLLGLIPG
jgi:hypothetical protein